MIPSGKAKAKVFPGEESIRTPPFLVDMILKEMSLLPRIVSIFSSVTSETHFQIFLLRKWFYVHVLYMQRVRVLCVCVCVDVLCVCV